MTEKVPLYRTLLGALTGIPLAVVYGVATRWLFAVDDGDLLLVMALGFICFVPLALGALTVAIAPRPLLRTLTYAIAMPWLSALLTMGVIALMRLEEIVCIVLASPLFLVLASVGGLVVRWQRTRGDEKSSGAVVGMFMILPFLITPLELQIPAPASVRTVETSIVVDAPTAVIWANIVDVPTISATEQRFSPFHWLGLPRPLRAEMTYPGAERVRYGYFEQGLIFEEKIVGWQEEVELAFTIDRDPTAQVPPRLLQIDGPYFQVLDGYYRLEPLDDGTVRLHLSSRHQLTTHFNAYAGLWTDAVMRDLQEDILEIVGERTIGN